jgi:hypothetical protein
MLHFKYGMVEEPWPRTLPGNLNKDQERLRHFPQLELQPVNSEAASCHVSHREKQRKLVCRGRER